MGAVLAIDHGEKKSGFAVADALRIAVHPLDPIRAPGGGEELLAGIAALLGERDVDTLLVGMPYGPGGARGERARSVASFAERLGRRFPGVAVVLWDERLTTKEAEDLLRREGFRGRAVKERRDSWSALVLLRDWLESGEPRQSPR